MIDPRLAHLEPDLAVTAARNGRPPAEESKTPKQADRLVAIALEHVRLFRSPDGTAYATATLGDHEETWPLRSKRFRAWLQRSAYSAEGKTPGAQAVQDALGVLEGTALFAGTEEQVALRIAGDDRAVYIDLGGDSWEAAEITASGWRLRQPPVRMRRSSSMAALPTPTPGGSLDDLRRFINVRDERDWMMLVGWLVAALRPRGPYPVLALHGEHGAAKSTVARMLRALVDPNTAPLRADPRDPRDLMISANNGWIVALDNLSRVQPWLSDALCRLSTGGGFSTRELYSDSDETIFDAQRPTILTGIEELATRGDLLDRALVVYLPTIPENERCSERELWADFERLRPRMVGALLDAIACAVSELPTTRLSSAPRMADFAEWVTAAEPALGWEPGAFMDAYAGNRGEANELTLDASPIAPAVRELASEGFEGIASELLERLSEITGEAAVRRKGWPGAPSALSGELRRIAPNLREIGVAIEFLPRRHGGRRPITITTAQGDGGDAGDDDPRTHSIEDTA